MEITLIRHGRSSLMENHRMNNREFKKWVKMYNHLGILEGETCSSDAKEKGISASFLLTSDLKRSIESAKSINPSAKIQTDPLFRETELPIPAGKFPGMRLRPNTWAVLLRLLWLCGYSQGCESYRDAKLRAKQASLTLTSIAKEHHFAVLVGHGFFQPFNCEGTSKSWVDREEENRFKALECKYLHLITEGMENVNT